MQVRRQLSLSSLRRKLAGGVPLPGDVDFSGAEDGDHLLEEVRSNEFFLLSLDIPSRSPLALLWKEWEGVGCYSLGHYVGGRAKAGAQFPGLDDGGAKVGIA